MRNIFLMILIALCLAACNSDAPQPRHAKTDTTMAMPAGTAMVADANTPVDPVCEMPYDTSWTDITVYERDTVRFCSEACKKTFLARPGKYRKSKSI